MLLLGLVFRLGALVLSILISISTWSNFILERFSLKRSESNVLYDYIVVGGGSAGSTVAGRLAQNGFNILLLEAGGPPPWWATLGTVDIPIFGPLWQRTDLDWSYSTVSQTHSCGAFNNRVSLWPRGRVLGGSGRLNNMVYLRGHEKDWKSWEYSQASMLHYFKKSELQLGCYKNDSSYHNSDGWLPVSDMPMKSELSDAVLNAAKELGYFVGDLNTMSHAGFMEVQTNTLNGARFSADAAFLYAGKLPNLHVRTNSHVSQVVVDQHNEVKGVVFYNADGQHHAECRHGVILSAGAIGSPKILLQSGIGPADHLSEIGIPVKISSPYVGKNLQDHASTGSDLVLLNASLALSLSNLVHPSSFWDYVFKGKGPLTHGGCEVTGLLYTRFSDPNEDPPDIQLLVLPAGQSFDDGSLLRHNMGLQDKVWNQYFSHKTDNYKAIGITILVILLHPWSHGELKLQSADPFDSPLINPKYLSDPRDVETLVEGIYAVKKLIKTEAMAKLGAHLNPKPMPGCETHEFDSHDYWLCYVRMLTYTVYHPAGTCRMGPEKTAVVDRSFRVHGTSNLYVVDASVMPSLPSANINAAVVALAERAADVLTDRVTRKRRNQNQSPQHTYFSIMETLQQDRVCYKFVNNRKL
ncbi:Glucose dehydrogenase [Frankliniella occidentalis]|uniref:Glucose dehydrogenase [FAD, quinone] n=1 Tax=Frankliniella occidentalis TaxID=133901 RepID=A0A6J1TAM7_FRAOC|nr:glucose dehydrogenase [FAD, quinone] [Frankliniella occidentalis]KAE8738623.1 Glucose dehydrogenase [Frankliniella occidentalis]